MVHFDAYTISELVDLSLQKPEIGAVNFNILHIVLKALIKHIGIESLLVHINLPDESKAILGEVLHRTGDILQTPRLYHDDDEFEDHQGSDNDREEAESPEDSENEQEQEQPIPKKKVTRIEQDSDDEKEEKMETEQQKEDEEKTAREREGKKPQRKVDRQRKGYSVETEEHESSDDGEIVEGYEDRVPDDEAEMSDEDEYGPLRTGGAQKLRITNLAESWRDSNVEKRVRAMEDFHFKICSSLDSMLVKQRDIEQKTEAQSKFVMAMMDTKLEEMHQRLENIKPTKTTVEPDIEALKEKVTQLDETKANKIDVMTKEEVMSEVVSQEPPQSEEDIKNIKETIQFLLDQMGLKYVPEGDDDDAHAYSVEGEEATQRPLTVNDKFDEIWKQLENIMIRVKNSTPGSEVESSDKTKVDHLERLLKKLVDQVETLKEKSDISENENKRKNKSLEVMLNVTNELQAVKADREEIKSLLDQKASKEEMEAKTDRSEFVATIKDIGETMENIIQKAKDSEEARLAMLEQVTDGLKMKLSTADYQTLQIPVNNRIKSIMYALKKVKSIILSMQYPDACCTSTCIGCGRCANLTGVECLPCDDLQKGDIHRFTIKGGPPSSKKLELGFDDRPSLLETPKSVNNLEGDDRKTLASPLTYKDLISPVGLARPRGRTEIDAAYAKLMPASGGIRFCGGRSTITEPQARGVKFMEVTLPDQTTREVSIMGYDNNVYEGRVKLTTSDLTTVDVDTNPAWKLQGVSKIVSDEQTETTDQNQNASPSKDKRSVKTPGRNGGTVSRLPKRASNLPKSSNGHKIHQNMP